MTTSPTRSILSQIQRRQRTLHAVLGAHVAAHVDDLSRLIVASGLVGLHIYGLTDALALGSKPGIAFWMALGLLAALPQAVQYGEGEV